MRHFLLSKKKKKKKKKKKRNKKRSLFPVDNCNVGVTIKVVSRLKTNTLVSAMVSSGTGQLGIDF